MTIVLLTAVPVSALVDDEEPVVVRVDPGPSPVPVVPSPSPTPEPSPSPQPAPSPSPSPAPQPAPTRRSPPPAPKPAPRPTTGRSVEIPEAGIWVVDTADRSVRGLADAGPFDVAGDKVLVARGMSVYEVPVAGGDPVLRYTVPSLAGSSVAFDPASEAVTMIEAAPDGSAVVASLVPVLNAEGQKVGATGGTALVDPTGAIRSRDLTGMVEWSDEGSLLAVVDYRGLRALRPDGSVAGDPWRWGRRHPTA